MLLFGFVLDFKGVVEEIAGLLVLFADDVQAGQFIGDFGGCNVKTTDLQLNLIPGSAVKEKLSSKRPMEDMTLPNAYRSSPVLSDSKLDVLMIAGIRWTYNLPSPSFPPKGFSPSVSVLVK